jgi:hypothetical protein
MGVVIDSGFGLDAEAVHDDFGASPLQDGFLDLLAKIVAADFAAEAVVLEVIVPRCEGRRGMLRPLGASVVPQLTRTQLGF